MLAGDLRMNHQPQQCFCTLLHNVDIIEFSHVSTLTFVGSRNNNKETVSTRIERSHWAIRGFSGLVQEVQQKKLSAAYPRPGWDSDSCIKAILDVASRVSREVISVQFSEASTVGGEIQQEKRWVNLWGGLEKGSCSLRKQKMLCCDDASKRAKLFLLKICFDVSHLRWSKKKLLMNWKQKNFSRLHARIVSFQSKWLDLQFTPSNQKLFIMRS